MKEKQGELAKAGIPGLLHQIYLRRDESAILDIIKEPVRKRFFFRRGIPVAASSNILNEVLGRLLMQEGIITQQQYETSLEVVLREKKRHGEVLIGMGLLTPQLLEDFLALQLKRRLFRLFDWSEGFYRYIKSDFPSNIHARPFHPGSLILEGISLGFYPVARLRAALDAWLAQKATLAIEGGAYTLDDFQLNLQERRFAESIDGTRRLDEAIASSDLLHHRAESIALSLIMTGLMRDENGAVAVPGFSLEETKDTQAPEMPVDSKLNAELLFMRARTAIARGEFPAAIQVLKDITNINPAEGEYWAYLGWAMYNEDPSRIKEAESIIKDSIDLNNDLDSAWYFLGMISLAQGNIAWAQRALQTAIQKNPWNTEALSELKRLELRLIYRDASKEVLDAFGFIEDPFAPVPKKVTLSDVQNAALEALVRGVRKKPGPVFLSGKDGTGKTTIILELLKRLSADKVLSSVVLKPASREMELIKDINRGLGCPASAITVKDELLSLGMRVSQNRIQGGSTLIIIDEAHRLSAGCLKLIQYLSRLKAVQLLLSGEPSFAERLKSPDFQELDEKTGARITLSELSREEVAVLIDSMLSKARRVRKEGRAFFSIGLDEAHEIFESTGGNPGAVRREAAIMLQKAYDGLEPMKAAPAAGETVKEESLETSLELPSFEEIAEEPDREGPQGAGPIHEEIIESAPEAVEEREEAPPVEEPQAPQALEPPASAPAAGPAPPLPQNDLAKHEPLPGPAPVAFKKEEHARRSIGRLIFWVLLMIIAGLAVGSLIGTYWFGQTSVQEERIAPPAPAAPPAPSQEETDKAGPMDSTLDTARPDGSI